MDAILVEIREVLEGDGRSEGDVNAILDRIRRVFAAVEAKGIRVDRDLAWCVLGLVGITMKRLPSRKAKILPASDPMAAPEPMAAAPK